MMVRLHVITHAALDILTYGLCSWPRLPVLRATSGHERLRSGRSPEEARQDNCGVFQQVCTSPFDLPAQVKVVSVMAVILCTRATESPATVTGQSSVPLTYCCAPDPSNRQRRTWGHGSTCQLPGHRRYAGRLSPRFGNNLSLECGGVCSRSRKLSKASWPVLEEHSAPVTAFASAPGTRAGLTSSASRGTAA